MRQAIITPRIYVACLASYNNGVLHGRWIDASDDVETMQAEVSAMLRESRFPNVTVPDYEAAARAAGWDMVAHSGMFAGPVGSDVRLADYDDWEELCTAQGIEPLQVPSAEEWAIHDSEYLPDSFGEYPGLEKIAAYVALLDEHDSLEPDDLAAIVENWTGNLEEAASNLADNFAGVYDSFREYADEQADEMIAAHGALPKSITNYFDYESYARDLRHDLTVVDVPSGVAVFYP